MGLLTFSSIKKTLRAFCGTCGLFEICALCCVAKNICGSKRLRNKNNYFDVSVTRINCLKGCYILILDHLVLNLTKNRFLKINFDLGFKVL